jgi:hypothetical protein
MTQFASSLGKAFSQTTGIQNAAVKFIEKDGKPNTVIKLNERITLKQSRLLLVKAVASLDKVIQENPNYKGLFGGKYDPNNMTLVIDAYNDKLPKEQQSGVSSVMLVNGRVHFMGISQKTGSEILMHKEPLRDSMRIVDNQMKMKPKSL